MDRGIGQEVGQLGLTRGRITGSDWRLDRGIGEEIRWSWTRAFHIQKRIKHFSFKNYIKNLLNLVIFSPPFQFSQRNVNTTMSFSTKRKGRIGLNKGRTAGSNRGLDWGLD